VSSEFHHFFHEFQSSAVLGSLKGGSPELSTILPWSSGLFSIELPENSTCYGNYIPTFLTRRIYGKVVHAPFDLSESSYLLQPHFSSSNILDINRLPPIGGNHNMSMLASSILRLEWFVGANALQFHDTQFVVTSNLFQLFDTMISLCDGPACLCDSAPVAENDPCLSTTYLRAYLLQTALWLMLERVYLAQSSADDVRADYLAMHQDENDENADNKGTLLARTSWKARLVVMQRAKSRSCRKHELRAILTGVPAAVPRDVIQAIEADSVGHELLARLRALSEQFPKPANGAGLVCLDDIPEPKNQGHNKCALGIDQSGWDSAQALLSTQGQALYAEYKSTYLEQCGYLKYPNCAAVPAVAPRGSSRGTCGFGSGSSSSSSSPLATMPDGLYNSS
jgi:hypothetical protein